MNSFIRLMLPLKKSRKVISSLKELLSPKPSESQDYWKKKIMEFELKVYKQTFWSFIYSWSRDYTEIIS